LPRVLVLGGPNGAGKTTAARTLLPDRIEIRQFVNADVIASGLSAYAPETAAIQAGRIMLTRLAELSRLREDFAFETTLASRSFAPFLRALKSQGYTITIFYVWLRSPALAVQRVAARVRDGGHHVPAETIQQRYWRGLANFGRLYRPLADAWVLCDNSGTEPVVVAQADIDQGQRVVDVEAYREVERAIAGERQE
jgi:predicted ABC-type ATPase